MSTQRGNVSRSRPQKYRNKTAFKNDLHDKSNQIKMLNSLHVCEVCERCKAVIEWKIKYKKYKPLKQPKTCIKCQQRNVKKAYHVLCRDCALNEKICAKCMISAEQANIIPPQPTEEEQIKLKAEMDRLIKSLSERKRRTFLRYMAKGKDKPKNCDEDDEIHDDKDDKEESEEDSKKHKNRIPHTREDLLKKIDELKEEDDEDGEDDEDLDDSDFEGFSDEDC